MRSRGGEGRLIGHKIRDYLDVWLEVIVTIRDRNLVYFTLLKGLISYNLYLYRGYNPLTKYQQDTPLGNDSSDDSQALRFYASQVLTFLPSTTWQIIGAPLVGKFRRFGGEKVREPRKKKRLFLWGLRIRGKFAQINSMTGKHSDVMSFQLVFN